MNLPSSFRSRPRAWAVRAAGFALAGGVGEALVLLGVFVLNLSIGPDPSPTPIGDVVAVVAVAAVAFAAAALLLWRVLVRGPRRGPGWGAVAGAGATALLVATVVALMLAVGAADSPTGALRAGALLYLLQLPVTLLGATTGAALGAGVGPFRTRERV